MLTSDVVSMLHHRDSSISAELEIVNMAFEGNKSIMTANCQVVIL